MKARPRLAILIAVWLFLGFSTAESQELRKIKIGYPAISYNQIHI